MSTRMDDALTKKIFTEYATFLDERGIPYNNRQGFFVKIMQANGDYRFVHVCNVIDGKVLITDYCGTCNTGIRMANRVAKAVRTEFPDYNIVVEKYGAFEIEIYHEVGFSTIEELHLHVTGVAHVAERGAEIGKEMIGEEFVR